MLIFLSLLLPTLAHADPPLMGESIMVSRTRIVTLGGVFRDTRLVLDRAALRALPVRTLADLRR